MNSDHDLNYSRIAQAIAYIRTHYRDQPDLDEVARQVHLSPYHFQRLFKEWAGVTPKKFLQYISLAHAKQLLNTQQATLFDATQATGLSGTGRLHDLFVSIEGMTPGAYKSGGAQLNIHYSLAATPFGRVLIASTDKGVCFMSFTEDEEAALAEMYQQFPKARFSKQSDEMQQNALQVFSHDWRRMDQVKLHLKGTPFQLKVWEALLKIPMGQLSTYGRLAQQIQQPRASRAVGTAIGRNPVAFLIPCHRVIQASGITGGYKWGTVRKTAMIGWESAVR